MLLGSSSYYYCSVPLPMTLFQVRTRRGAFFAPDDYCRDRKEANPSDPEDHPGGSLVDFKRWRTMIELPEI